MINEKDFLKPKNKMKGQIKRLLKELSSLLEEYRVKIKEKNNIQNIFFIIIDCLRKDHLSLYGYYRDTTPFLNSLIKKRAAIFENAYAASSWTYPSVASLLTGLYPHNHGGIFKENLRNMDNGMLPQKVNQYILTLPEILSFSKFETLFITAIPTAGIVFSEGFTDSIVYYAGADHHLKDIFSWLNERGNSKCFIYWQIGDLHVPVHAPEPYRSTFGDIAEIPNVDRWDFQQGGIHGDQVFEAYKENRIRLYDAALRFVDSRIEELFQYLELNNLLDKTLICITADHGEELWDHAELEKKNFYDPRGCYGVGHGHNLFQEVVNVPMIVTGPGVNCGSYSKNVSTVDIMPTVLGLCNVHHQLQLDGYPLFNGIEDRVILSEDIAYGYEKKVLVQDIWKYLYSEGDNVHMLFNLSRDPGENNNLAEIHVAKVRELYARLPLKVNNNGEKLEVDKDTEQRLKDLGYL